MKLCTFPFAFPSPFYLLHLNMSYNVCNSKYWLSLETIRVKWLKIEMYFLITILQNSINCTNIRPILYLIIQKLYFLSFSINHGLHCSMRAFDHISSPARAPPKNVDIKSLLNILFLNILVEMLNILYFAMHFIDVLLYDPFIIVLHKVLTMIFYL